MVSNDSSHPSGVEFDKLNLGLVFESVMSLTMNTVPNCSAWRTVVLGALGFWLSASVILDGLVMPGLYMTGMMAQDGFASAGYSLFWVFNRLELVLAALILTGVLRLRYEQQLQMWESRRSLGLGFLLIAIALLYTYALTPEMGALGLHLNWFTTNEFPSTSMALMHQSYWMLEVIKLAVCGALLRSHYRLRLG